MHLYKKLFISEGEDVGDGGGFVIEAESREQQEEDRRSRATSVSGALTELTRRLTDKLDKTHHQPLSHALTAELTLKHTHTQSVFAI